MTFLLPNSTDGAWVSDVELLEWEEWSPCVEGIIPVIYYSVLLGLGLPVNILTAIALSRLAARTKKSSYWYLLALTASDILTQVIIVFMGFILQMAILAHKVPHAFLHTVNVLQFAANHASIWVTVLLTADRYVALCHPLRYRMLSYPERTRKIIAAVFCTALATGIPFYWWLDIWHDSQPPTTVDKVLKWIHCFTMYFIPCSIFLATNSVIVCKLKWGNRVDGHHRRVGKTIAMLMAVTAIFTVLWAPRTFVILFHLYMGSTNKNRRLHVALNLANMIAMLNTTVNFFFYCFVSKTFRRTAGEVIRSCSPFCKPTNGGFLHSALKPLGLLENVSL
ncbi:probable G-protein coupled receptor 142 [Gopherus flavomarginatus]|uniref:probable G-protein coupled receptor 142 n=1 Tax=Gopherus flavomarginatus TaxID=286002 RepID=UPI0021CC2447|nr:probable G-protein coupled receptor 142 [Gopherus flavomarginatus]